jgi:hypothetical protein
MESRMERRLVWMQLFICVDAVGVWKMVMLQEVSLRRPGPGVTSDILKLARTCADVCDTGPRLDPIW